MLKLSNVLCPVDFSEFSTKAYDYAFSLARHYDAKLFVQHVTEPALALYRSYISPQTIEDVYSRQTAYVRERLDELMRKHPVENVKAEPVIQLGSAADSILAFAEERDIDLIAMGTHGRRGLDGAPRVGTSRGSNTRRGADLGEGRSARVSGGALRTDHRTCHSSANRPYRHGRTRTPHF